MPAHLSIFHPPPLCNNLGIIMIFFYYYYYFYFSDLILLLLTVLWWTNTSRYFLPQDGHPQRHGTEGKLACVVAVVSLCYQSCSQRVRQGSFSLPSSSLGESCVLGRSAESIKGKMWEGRGWAHHGGWDGGIISYNNRVRNKPLGEVKTSKEW